MRYAAVVIGRLSANCVATHFICRMRVIKRRLAASNCTPSIPSIKFLGGLSATLGDKMGLSIDIRPLLGPMYYGESPQHEATLKTEC